MSTDLGDGNLSPTVRMTPNWQPKAHVAQKRSLDAILAADKEKMAAAKQRNERQVADKFKLIRLPPQDKVAAAAAAAAALNARMGIATHSNALFESWAAAKQARDFEAADRIRDQLRQQGFEPSLPGKEIKQSSGPLPLEMANLPLGFPAMPTPPPFKSMALPEMQPPLLPLPQHPQYLLPQQQQLHPAPQQQYSPQLLPQYSLQHPSQLEQGLPQPLQLPQPPYLAMPPQPLQPPHLGQMIEASVEHAYQAELDQLRADHTRQAAQISQQTLEIARQSTDIAKLSADNSRLVQQVQQWEHYQQQVQAQVQQQQQ